MKKRKFAATSGGIIWGLGSSEDEAIQDARHWSTGVIRFGLEAPTRFFVHPISNAAIAHNDTHQGERAYALLNGVIVTKRAFRRAHRAGLRLSASSLAAMRFRLGFLSREHFAYTLGRPLRTYAKWENNDVPTPGSVSVLAAVIENHLSEFDVIRDILRWHTT